MAEVPERFVELIAEVTATLVDQPLSPASAETLAQDFPPDGALVAELAALCRIGCDEGWLCARAADGIRFGRPVKPGPATHGFSVDVVEMDDVVGPHHVHPQGEVDLVMPLNGPALFDGVGRGWKVYGPGSAHFPTVTGGKALILYLLPQGAIEFTRG